MLEFGFDKKQLEKIMSEHVVAVPELDYAVIPATVSYELPASVLRRMKKAGTQKYQIQTSGVLVRKKFDTREEAQAWGEWNYKSDNWEVVPA